MACHRHHPKHQWTLQPGVIPCIMRWVQTRMVSYQHQLLLDGHPSTPLLQFSELPQLVTMNQFKLLPNLPDRVALTKPNSGATPSSAAPKPTSDSKPAAQPNTTPRPTSASSSNPPSTAQRTTGRNGALVLNPTVNPDWKRTLDASNKKIRNIHQHAPAFTNTDSDAKPIALCLSYRLRGSCYSNCARTATHRPLAATESSTLADMIHSHLSAE